MGYVLGIDLGTTFSAAAVAAARRAEIVPLGNRSAAIPSVVLLRADGEVLVGEAAERRGLAEPTRTAREFKRRLGDPTPLLLGGTPYGAETLTAHLLGWIVAKVIEMQGGPPDRIVLCHPANYGPYKLDLLTQAARIAGIGSVQLISEPAAAAVWYAQQERVDVGEHIAVYDFGGGTFDAAVVRRTATGFDLIGNPEGLERLGGIDFDQAVYGHVERALGEAVDDADWDDPATLAALTHLREECRAAKEALSSDTDAQITVMLPKLRTEVRITRREFEDLIRPRLAETAHALERAVSSAGLRQADLSRILLVGGSSRIPLVIQLVRETTGRPIAVDAHPKHAVALGAALAGLGSTEAAGIATSDARVPPPPPPPPPPAAATPIPAPAHETRHGRRGLVVGALGVAVIAGIAAIALAGGGSGSSSDGSPAETSSVPTTGTSPATTAAATTAGSTATTPGAATTGAATTGATTASTAGTSASGGTSNGLGQGIVSIDEIRREGSTYVVSFTAIGFEPTEGGDHIHFYFAGSNPAVVLSGGQGDYFDYGGPSPFVGLSTSDAPPGSVLLCASVAGPDHTVVPLSGNCAALPV